MNSTVYGVEREDHVDHDEAPSGKAPSREPFSRAPSRIKIEPAEWSVRNRRAFTSESVRIAFYSHDTVGLGHTRRNLLIAKSLTEAGIQVDILLITGTRVSTSFALPPGVDCLTLPSLHKDLNGSYVARSLDISLNEITKLRSETIWAALKAFKPDLFVVDNVPRGAAGELNLALRKLKKKGRTRCVLGLRDILDSPEAVREQWRALKNKAAVRDLYDAVWVYGDPVVYDLAHEYSFSRKIDKKVQYLGYFDPRVRLSSSRTVSAETAGILAKVTQPFVLCQAGGGQDGQELAAAFARTKFPEGMQGILITGPFMPAKARHRLFELATSRSDLHVLEFLEEPTELLLYASKVIAMAGYNTVLETLAFEKPLLVVPRVKPRQEQLIRAQRFSALGLLDMLHPNDMTPETLRTWLERDVAIRHNVHEQLSFDALTRLREQIQELVGRELRPRRRIRQIQEEAHAAA